MPRITIRQVEAFRAVMLTGTMTAAANLLHITQPAISRLIQDFEAISGLQLFERRASHVVPTRDAINLAEQVEKAFIGLGKIEQYVNEIRSQQAGSIRIAANPALATEVLPRFIVAFTRIRPLIRIRIDALQSSQVADGVASGELDFGYVQTAMDRPGFHVEKLRGEAVVVMRFDHPLSAKTVITPEDLGGQTIVSCFGNRFQDRLDVLLGRVERFSLASTRQAHLACVLASEGGGIAIVDPFSAAMFRSRGLVARRLLPTVDVESGLITAVNRPPTPLGQAFIDSFRDHTQELARLVFSGDTPSCESWN